MRSSTHRRFVFGVVVCAIILCVGTITYAQSTATVLGTVRDDSGAAIPGAKVVLKNSGTNVVRSTVTDATGNYQFTALEIGTYSAEVSAPNMQKQLVKGLVLEVSRTVQQNFQLKVASTAETVEVTAENPILEATTMTVGQVINQKTVQEIPLNGRHFVDLGLLIPGSVAPPQAGFLTAPLRGQGSFAFNTAGQREDTVNFMINGINLNDMVQNQITFQPSINTVQEFKADNSTYSAEFGRNSGAIVNIGTRSGTNNFHGEVFEFLRNDAFDAKNFFNSRMAPFKRNNFGAAVGGPIFKNRTFFFGSYEGTRQRQGLTINQQVLDAAQRAAVTDPVSQNLLAFIPEANTGPNIFQGSATAPVDIDQWTGDVSHRFGDADSLHVYYAFQRDHRGEPTLQGNNIPGFGDTRQSHRQIGTINYSHTFTQNIVNEARLGFNRIHITFEPNNPLDPSSLGINDGITGPIGIPQLNIRSSGLNFGGPGGFPQGRGDTTYVLADTLSWQKGRHFFHFGGEFRRFNNNNFAGDTGTATYANEAAFASGDVNAFSITPGSRPSRIFVTALAGFVQDSIKVTRSLTVELGLRYDWNGTPSEAQDRFVVFDKATSSLVRLGQDIENVYEQNNKNFQPRVGFAWDVFRDGKTVLRGGYGLMTDQPVTNSVTALASNPPFAATSVFSPTLAQPTIKLSNALAAANGSGITINTIDPNFQNPYVQSWNLNIQRELPGQTVLMAGYFGSKGTHLRLSRNANQPINGVAPFPTLSPTSPIRPVNCPALPTPCNLAVSIPEITSAGNSNYNGLWVTANKRISRGLQFNTSYTWSKSLDYNSLSSDGIRVQDGYNPRLDYGPSDFDVRHRFVASLQYELPFKGNRLVSGWQVGTITQAQSGNPIANIIITGVNVPGQTGLANTNTFTGVNNLRPDVLQPIHVTGDPTQWFANASVCDPRIAAGVGACGPDSVFAVPVSPGGVFHFGNLGRNSITGPSFVTTDFSIIKTTKISERFSHQFRFEAFDLFNHPNFGNPGRIAQVGSTNFGVITNTRFPTGDSGSSRQLQFAMKLIF